MDDDDSLLTNGIAFSALTAVVDDPSSSPTTMLPPCKFQTGPFHQESIVDCGELYRIAVVPFRQTP